MLISALKLIQNGKNHHLLIFFNSAYWYYFGEDAGLCNEWDSDSVLHIISGDELWIITWNCIAYIFSQSDGRSQADWVRLFLIGWGHEVLETHHWARSSSETHWTCCTSHGELQTQTKKKNQNHQSRAERLTNIDSLYPEEVEPCVHLSRTDLSAHTNLQHLSGPAHCGSWTLLVFLTSVSAWVKAPCAAPFHSCFNANKAGANPLSTLWLPAPPLPNKQSRAPHLPP